MDNLPEEEILNESTAEAELKDLKRHGNEEELIRIEKTDGDNPELILEEDHGQGDADDKEHIGINFVNRK